MQTRPNPVRLTGLALMASALIALVPAPAVARQQPAVPVQSQPAAPATVPAAAATDANGAPVPSGYVIGPSDVLSIRYWREDQLSGDVTVRPDGRISLPLINDIQAAGLTTDLLRQKIAEAAARYIESPVVSVIVREIRSRKVYITGMVAKPGEYALLGPTTVLQLIALAGGLHEYADAENITIIRPSEKNARGQEMSYRFNYKDVAQRRNLAQNIELKPGDTIVVP